MKLTQYMTHHSLLLLLVLACSMPAQTLHADDGYRLWMKYDRLDDARMVEQYQNVISGIHFPGSSPTLDAARTELNMAMNGLIGANAPAVNSIAADDLLVIGTPQTVPAIRELVTTGELAELGSDGFILRSVSDENRDMLLVAANTDIGVLYGTFHLLRLMQTGHRLTTLDIVSVPKIERRILNHWDNLNGSVERGYAGQSLWNWDELPDTVDPRYTDYARANASLGINGTVVNNVNATPLILQTEYIEKLKELADVFRPYGIKLYLAINFSSPMKPAESRRGRGGIGDLDTADPLEPAVRKWWRDKADEIYATIPDFGGFLVKANSEGQPGPQDFGRTQVDGANMLADALKPHGGIVMWRAFVYDADVDPDRVKRAYLEFVPHDGTFEDTVFIQVKNGPLDFQPREPYSPLFGAMPKTPLMIELQITQEYLGHSNHLVYLAPMWKEVFNTETYAQGRGSSVATVIDGSLHEYPMSAIAGVTNIGNDRNWTGHLFGQSNWYAYGRLAWDHTLTSEAIADEWIRMTFTHDLPTVMAIKDMMLGSREACVDYMNPLGLHHIMQEGVHYGPQPSFTRPNIQEDWTSVYYHRADEEGLGFNRSSTGSNAVGQYYDPLRSLFDNLETCPEEYLLWFHHVPWDYELDSGRTLWDELCFRYYRGVQYVTAMRDTWASLESEIDSEQFAHVSDKLVTHERDAAIWRDTCTEYFQTFSKMPIPERQ